MKGNDIVSLLEKNYELLFKGTYGSQECYIHLFINSSNEYEYDFLINEDGMGAYVFCDGGVIDNIADLEEVATINELVNIEINQILGEEAGYYDTYLVEYLIKDDLGHIKNQGYFEVDDNFLNTYITDGEIMIYIDQKINKNKVNVNDVGKVLHMLATDVFDSDNTMAFYSVDDLLEAGITKEDLKKFIEECHTLGIDAFECGDIDLYGPEYLDDDFLIGYMGLIECFDYSKQKEHGFNCDFDFFIYEKQNDELIDKRTNLYISDALVDFTNKLRHPYDHEITLGIEYTDNNELHQCDLLLRNDGKVVMSDDIHNINILKSDPLIMRIYDNLTGLQHQLQEFNYMKHSLSYILDVSKAIARDEPIGALIKEKDDEKTL